jgi:hypothetical protein
LLCTDPDDERPRAVVCGTRVTPNSGAQGGAREFTGKRVRPRRVRATSVL